MNTILLAFLLLSPQQMRATTTAHSVTLTWGASTVGTGCVAPASLTYTVLRGPTSGSEVSIATGMVLLTYTDTNVTAGSTYFYVVQGVELCGTTSISSANSNEVSATIPLPSPSAPSPPTNLQVVPGSVTTSAPRPKAKRILGIFPRSASLSTTAPNALTLSWTCSPSALQGPVYQGQVYYNMYRNGVAVNPSPIFCNELLCHYYDNNGLVAGSTYTYLATAWTPVGGESGPSNSVSQVIP